MPPTPAIPILVAALQLLGPITPTPEDSAWAWVALDQADLEIAQDDSAAWVQGIWSQLLDQTRFWRGFEAAWDRAWSVDSTLAKTSRYGYTRRLIGPLVEAHGLDAAKDRLARLPTGARDTLLAAAANSPNVVSELWTELLETVRTPVPRAWVLSSRAEALLRGRDTTAAIDTLRLALEMARPLGDPGQYAWRLLQLGVDVPVDTLVSLTPQGLYPGARVVAATQVADRLSRVRPEMASSLADSLYRSLAGDTTWLAKSLRFRLLETRGHPGDSARSRATRDSVIPPEATAADARQAEVYRIARALQAAAESRDSAAFLKGLAELPPGAARPFHDGARSAQLLVASRPWSPSWLPLAEDRAWAMFVFRTSWTASGAMDARTRDSARVALVALVASMDPVRALDSAKAGVVTQPWKDRARAEAIVRLAATDADEATTEFRTIEDPEARGLAGSALVEHAVAGGRLTMATDLTDSMPPGVDRTRAELNLATAYARSGREQIARQRLRRGLGDLIPFPACLDPCFVRQSPPLADGELIRRTIQLALTLEMRDDLVEWAASRLDGHQRARAWLLLAQTLAQLKPGPRT